MNRYLLIFGFLFLKMLPFQGENFCYAQSNGRAAPHITSTTLLLDKNTTADSLRNQLLRIYDNTGIEEVAQIRAAVKIVQQLRGSLEKDTGTAVLFKSIFFALNFVLKENKIPFADDAFTIENGNLCIKGTTTTISLSSTAEITTEIYRVVTELSQCTNCGILAKNAEIIHKICDRIPPELNLPINSLVQNDNKKVVIGLLSYILFTSVSPSIMEEALRLKTCYEIGRELVDLGKNLLITTTENVKIQKEEQTEHKNQTLTICTITLPTTANFIVRKLLFSADSIIQARIEKRLGANSPEAEYCKSVYYRILMLLDHENDNPFLQVQITENNIQEVLKANINEFLMYFAADAGKYFIEENKAFANVQAATSTDFGGEIGILLGYNLCKSNTRESSLSFLTNFFTPPAKTSTATVTGDNFLFGVQYSCLASACFELTGYFLTGSRFGEYANGHLGVSGSWKLAKSVSAVILRPYFEWNDSFSSSRDNGNYGIECRFPNFKYLRSVFINININRNDSISQWNYSLGFVFPAL